MYSISTDKHKLDPQAVVRLLKQSYWAKDRSEALIRRSIETSECFGAYLDATGELIGFARVVTDEVSVFYICDVIVDESHRGMGVGKALIAAITTDERFMPLLGLLVTRDAHGLYEHFGFSKSPQRCMEKRPNR